MQAGADVHQNGTKYFREFWNRRIREKNGSIVFEILKEIENELYKKEKSEINEALVNDTLKNLLRIYQMTPTSNE